MPSITAGLMAILVLNAKCRDIRYRLLHSILFAPLTGITVGSAVAASVSLAFTAFQTTFPAFLPAAVNAFLPSLLVSVAAGALAGLIAASCNLLSDSMTTGAYVPFGPRAVQTDQKTTIPTVRRSRLSFLSRLPFLGRLGYVQTKTGTPLAQRLRLYACHIADMPPNSRRANLPVIVLGAVMLADGLLPFAQPILPVSVGWILLAISVLVIMFWIKLAWPWLSKALYGLRHTQGEGLLT
jgi:hypothetical protein